MTKHRALTPGGRREDTRSLSAGDANQLIGIRTAGLE